MSPSNRSLLARGLAILVIGATAIVPSIAAGVPAAAHTGVRAVLPSVSVSDVSVGEGTGGTVTAVFTVTQSAKAKSRITFETAADTATSPADFVRKTGTIRFAGKKLTRTVAVTVVGDAIDELDETFFLELTDASGADIADGEGVGTIVDNDAPPTVAVGDPVFVPEGQTGDTAFATVDVALSAPSGLDVSVDWATADGSATVADSDYVAGAGQLDFAPGETSAVVLIEVIGDVASEGDETFDVDLLPRRSTRHSAMRPMS